MRYVAHCSLLLLLGGCASSRESAPTEVLGTPAPEEAPQSRRDRDRERRMEEVWKAPFAVEHRGTRPDRQQRPTVVQAGTPVMVASADPVAPPEEPAPAPVAAPESAAAPPARPASERAPRATEPLLGEVVTSPPPATRAPATRTPTRPASTPSQPGGRTPARPATTTPPPNAPARTPAGTRTHVVAQGETLFGLARRYDVTVESIRSANKLSDDNIRIGQRLIIPAR